MPRKYVKKPRRTRLVKKLDKVFSEYIRTRDKLRYGGCFFCGGEIECCFHIIRRARYAVRWDDRNAVGANHICNYKEVQNSHPFVAKYISEFGHEQYLKLVELSKVQPKHSLDELQTMIDFFVAEKASILANPKEFISEISDGTLGA